MILQTIRSQDRPRTTANSTFYQSLGKAAYPGGGFRTFAIHAATPRAGVKRIVVRVMPRRVTDRKMTTASLPDLAPIVAISEVGAAPSGGPAHRGKRRPLRRGPRATHANPLRRQGFFR